MDNVLISIVIAVYNAEDYIHIAINSILTQGYTNWELILVDDCSTDNTQQVAAGYGDKRIIFIKNSDNLGAYARANQGIQNSKGEYIAILDQDDAMFANRLQLQKTFLDENPSVDVVGGYMVTFNDAHQIVGIVEQNLPASFEELIVQGKCFLHPTIMARRQWFMRNQYDPAFRRTGDYEMWVRTYKNSVFKLIPQPLIFYRTSGGIQPQWKYEIVYKDGKKLFKKNAALVPLPLRIKALSILYLKFRLYPVLAALGLLTRNRKTDPTEHALFQKELDALVATAG